MTSQSENSKFILVPNEYIDSLCEVLGMQMNLRTIFENPVLGECKKTIFGLAKLKSDPLVSVYFISIIILTSHTSLISLKHRAM